MTHLSKRFNNKVSGLVILAICTLVIAVLSVVIMDLLVFPVTIFAINHTGLFTRIFVLILLTALAAGIVYILLKRAMALHNDGFTFFRLLLRTGKTLLYYLGITVIFLTISAGVITFLYTVTKTNLTVIYKLHK